MNLEIAGMLQDNNDTIYELKNRVEELEYKLSKEKFKSGPDYNHLHLQTLKRTLDYLQSAYKHSNKTTINKAKHDELIQDLIKVVVALKVNTVL